MNYGFWLLVGQSAQISLAAQQARQLSGIQNQLAQQHFIQQQQALLAQVLFEAEQFAQRIVALAPHDPFAAGLLSFLRLRGTAEIHPGLFMTIESKRAWSQAVGCLEYHWKAAEQLPGFGDLGRRVLAALEGLSRHQSALGPNYLQQLAELEKSASALTQKRQYLIYALIACAGAIPLSFVVGLIFGFAGDSSTGGQILTTGVALGFIGSLLFGALALSTHSDARTARSRLDELQGRISAYNAFLSSPDGGQLLDYIARQHPRITTGV